jgi:TolB-like protein
LALAALLVVGMIWTRVGNERVLPGEQKAVAVTQKTADVAARPAIAILPFVNQSDDAARDYFADGLTQDIINALGRYSDLTVFSWNAVLPFKGKSVSPAELSGRLGARYHVEGSVRRTGDRVRVATQLVDADSRVIWSARLDEALADVFAVQDRITTQIAGALAIRLTDIEHQRVLGKPTDNLEAYDLVLRARPALQRPDRANLAEARSLLRRALQLDPNYAAAYAALAETYDIDVTMGWAEAPLRTCAAPRRWRARLSASILPRFGLASSWPGSTSCISDMERHNRRSTARSASIPTMLEAWPAAS